ncbi:MULTISPECIES: NAD(P)-dependent oxidoreductase [unclassified Streptosporangium]|uniref:NAD(P)-dependent oxidoreductase n=1 Tax=unclassified Streptosporangium TaxID=2632669 RepID=UPI002E2C1772|nr:MULTISPECIES: NAD(P)H-binding protein [unclassified Streptosporangium]
MSKIIVFGAGGRAGRAAVHEALRRGHQVTAVVRDPARHGDLAADGVPIVAGDVTDASGIARLAEGHDAAISAVYDAGAPQDVFFVDAARALLDGLTRAKVARLLVVGLASVLETASGTLLMDTPGYPQEYRSFYLGHAAGNDVLRTATTALDWLVVSPAGDFDHGGPRSGRYRTAPAEAESRISYADFAISLLDEIDAPEHHRTHLGVEGG